jgi:hypothetical protein
MYLPAASLSDARSESKAWLERERSRAFFYFFFSCELPVPPRNLVAP